MPNLTKKCVSNCRCVPGSLRVLVGTPGIFRCFYLFSVARARVTADDRSQTSGNPEIDECQMEQMPTDKLVDISPMALRMSSPFNADYWAVTN